MNEADELRQRARAMRRDWVQLQEEELRAANLQLDNVNARVAKLMDIRATNKFRNA